MRKTEGFPFRFVGSGEGQGRSGTGIRETRDDDTSAERFPDFSFREPGPKRYDGRNVGKTGRLSAIFCIFTMMRPPLRPMEPPARGIRRAAASEIVSCADLPACIRRRAPEDVSTGRCRRARLGGEAFRSVAGDSSYAGSGAGGGRSIFVGSSHSGCVEESFAFYLWK